MKKVIKYFLYILFALILALILLPFVFKGKVLNALKSEINAHVQAQIDFKDADISIIKSFPKFTISLDSLSIVGINNFKGIPLANIPDIQLTTDIASIIKSDHGLNIYSINVDQADVNIQVNEDGQANYNLSSSTEKNSKNSFFGNIQEYTISDSKLTYNDESSNYRINLTGINHEGNGDFSQSIFDFKTRTDIEDMDVIISSIPYLKNAKISGPIDFQVNLDNDTYTISRNELALNDLNLKLTGFIKQLKNAFDLDLKIEAPNNDVGSIISIIPGMYSSQFKNVKSNGTSFLGGHIKGVFSNDPIQYPTVNFDIKINNGYLKYPDLSLPIEDIDLVLNIISKSKQWKDMKIDLSAFKFKIQENEVLGKVNISNALGNFNIDAELDGELDVANISKAIPLSDVKIKQGSINGHLILKTTKDDLIKKSYTKMNVSGDLTGSNFDLTYLQKPLKISSFKSELNPQFINTQVDQLSFGDTDMTGSLNIEQPLTILTDQSQIKLKIKSASNNINVDELMMTLTDNENSSNNVKSTRTDIRDWHIVADSKAKKVKYGEYDIANVETKVELKNDALEINEGRLKLYNEAMEVNGQFENLSPYLNNEDKLVGNLRMNASKITAENYLASTESVGSNKDVVPVVIPNTINLNIQPRIDNLSYGKYDFKNTKGSIKINDGIAALTNGTTDAFRGQINFEGSYNALDIAKPLFDFKYNMSDIGFQEIFKESESFKVLAPIAEFIEGIFNSTLVISGPLKNDMMPDLTAITASGFLETIKGKISGFEPLRKLGEKLGIDALKNFDIQDSKNWFEIKDGYVYIKEHDYTVDDMLFRIGDNHSLKNVIDYRINAQIPREKLKSIDVVKNVEFGLTELEKLAGKNGINLDLGDYIKLDIQLTGSPKNPKIKITPTGSGGKSVKEAVKEKINEEKEKVEQIVKDKIKTKTEEVKDTVTKVVDKKIDEVSDKVKGKLGEEKDKLEDKIKSEVMEKIDSSIVGQQVDSLKDKIGEVIKDNTGTEIDSLKEKIKNWNPFKKKK